MPSETPTVTTTDDVNTGRAIADLVWEHMRFEDGAGTFTPEACREIATRCRAIFAQALLRRAG